MKALKIAVCSQGEGLSSLVDSRFGRCNYLVLVDTVSGDVESLPNPALYSEHGAGVASVQYLTSKGVQVVLAQNVGPNAYRALDSSGIRVHSAAGQTVGDAVGQFRKGLSTVHPGATVVPGGGDGNAKV